MLYSLSFFRFQFCVGAHNGWWCQKARLLPAISYIINNIKTQISTDSCKLHPAAVNGASRDFIKAFFDITFLLNTFILIVFIRKCFSWTHWKRISFSPIDGRHGASWSSQAGRGACRAKSGMGFYLCCRRLICEVVQSQRRPLLGPSPGWKCLLLLSYYRHY